MNTLKKLSVATAGAAFIALGTVSVAQAVTIGVSSRSDLAGDDSVNWATLGATFTDVTNPFTINSNDGKALNVSQPSENFVRRDQSPENGNLTGWNGNFAPGDALLFTNSKPGPITIDFNSPIAGGGTQIQANPYGSFTATIEAFNSDGISLGSFSSPSNSTNAADSSAIFIGLRSTDADIARLTFNANVSQGFAINQLDLVSSSATPVPFEFSVSSSATPVPFEFSPGLGVLAIGAWGAMAQLKSKVQKRKSSGSGFSINQ